MALSCTAGEPTGSSGVYDVRNFGAVGDGKAMDTAAIQKAVAAAAKAGGGTGCSITGIPATSIHQLPLVAIHVRPLRGEGHRLTAFAT